MALKMRLIYVFSFRDVCSTKRKCSPHTILLPPFCQLIFLALLTIVHSSTFRDYFNTYNLSYLSPLRESYELESHFQQIFSALSSKLGKIENINVRPLSYYHNDDLLQRLSSKNQYSEVSPPIILSSLGSPE